MELDLVRHARVAAPLSLVWEEVGSLDEILSKTGQIFDYELAPSGSHAALEVRVAWGPIKWTVECLASLTESRPREHVAFAVSAPSLAVRYQGSIDLRPVAEAETALTYRGYVECRHRFAARMRGFLAEMAEDSARSIMERVKVRAENRHQAREQLLQ